MTKKPKKTTPEPAQRSSDEPEELLDVVGTELREQLAVVAKRREALPEGGFDPELAGAAAALGRVILRAETERRTQRGPKLSAALVCAWLEEADDSDKHAVAAMLEGATGGSLL
jgi:hypothetical protein